jgi:hypothetical protein
MYLLLYRSFFDRVFVQENRPAGHFQPDRRKECVTQNPEQLSEGASDE